MKRISLVERNHWRKVAYCHNKRARKAGARGRLHFSAAQFIYQLSGRRCLRCGAVVPLSLDHVSPLALGGRGDMFNLQVLCCQCNQQKGLSLADYRRGWQVAAVAVVVPVYRFVYYYSRVKWIVRRGVRSA